MRRNGLADAGLMGVLLLLAAGCAAGGGDSSAAGPVPLATTTWGVVVQEVEPTFPAGEAGEVERLEAAVWDPFVPFEFPASTAGGEAMSIPPVVLAVVPVDLSSRPHKLTFEREMAAPPHVLFQAWTTRQLERWFAAPGTVSIRAEVNAAYFFETRFQSQRHPHYGRFLKLEADRLVEMTWLTAMGTRGVETLLTIEFTPSGSGTRLRLTHAGFPDEELRKGHEDAWPGVLDLLDESFRDAR